MKLIRLHIENFKGLRDFTFEPEGKNVRILGANGTFKTTIMDAYSWLLTGKDSLDQAAFEIKPLEESGDAVHNLDHGVSGTFLAVNGETIALKKIYAEKYTKKRGSSQAELTGHITSHFIDDVPVTQSQFQTAVGAIAPPELFKLLSNIRYFNEGMPWQKRRSVLLEVCGDVSDADIIAANYDLAELPKIIGKKSIDDWRKMATAQKAKINDELKEIPARIDELDKSKADVGGASRIATKTTEDELQHQLRAKQLERQRVESGGELAEKTKSLRQIEAKLLELDNRGVAQNSSNVAQKRSILEGLRNKHSKAKSDLEMYAARKAGTLEAISALAAEVQALRDQWIETDSIGFDHAPQSICPTCGQDLPEERLQEARDKALKDHNEGKAAILADISIKGKTKRQRIEELEATCITHDELIGKTTQDILELEQKIVELEEEIDPLTTASVESPEIVQERANLMQGKEVLEAAISELQLGNHDALVEVDTEIVHLQTQIQENQAVLAKIEANRRAAERIKELSGQEKKLAQEYEELEHGIYLTDLFIRTKVKALDEKINRKFNLVRFKLFDQLINGGIQEVCETMINGVPYRNLNEASRINAGIEIANVLSLHHGISLPMFVDGAESVISVLPSHNQQIKLIVSADYPALTVITEE